MSSFDSLLTAAQSGDAQGFDGLYRMFAGPVTGFVTTRGAEDPESLANDVILKVFRNLETFSGSESAFRGWVFTIARNQVIDAHRAAGRRPVSSGGALPEGDVQSAEVVAIGRLGDQRVERLLGLLTVDQREVIVLRMVADLSLEQVGAIVDKPVTAVKRLQSRGLARLQKEILAEGVSQ